ncbi:ribosomal protein S18 acetylase RimI-like enzyme [Nitrobacteraceae bacterium AZCC 1564]
MNSAIDIRYATAKDVPDIVALFARVVEPLDIYSQAARSDEIAKFSQGELQRRIADDARAISLAFVNNALAGFAITEDQRGPIWIHWYGVNPDVRGHGVGREILQHLIASAPERGGTRIWCDTRTTNVGSIALLKELRFEQLCELKNHWHGQDFYLWSRDI